MSKDDNHKDSSSPRKIVRHSQIWQNTSRGRARPVAVEVKKSRAQKDTPSPSSSPKETDIDLSQEERKARQEALNRAAQTEDALPTTTPSGVGEPVIRPPSPPKAASQDAPHAKQSKEKDKDKDKEQKFQTSSATPPAAAMRKKPARSEGKKPKKQEGRRKGKLTITQALDDGGERMRSLAAIHRARERQRQESKPPETQEASKTIREVIIPETIRVSDLTTRMAEKSADVIKTLMELGIMATINATIDADTAELVVNEFGHKARRVRESDVELGLDIQDDEASLKPRPPVVTIMGHVDHGKTSLLDALQKSTVAQGEAGGITQHIGAYQIKTTAGHLITFLDTPGHEAFSAMRKRGAKVTDIAIIVVAGDDGVMPQTVEAINHARSAGVPIIIAVTKMDLPDANADKIYDQLLQHEIIVEKKRGDILACEISAKDSNLTPLEEAIHLQAELMEMKANPDRPAAGTVVEAKIERGRGPMATALIQHGTLKKGDIVIAGAEWGKIRLMLNDKGQNIAHALPGMPVAIFGLNGVPLAGDELITVPNENRARDIAQYRARSRKDALKENIVSSAPNFDAQKEQEFAVLIKADVRGSVEAITYGLAQQDQEECTINVVHGAVGEVSESDVSLAATSNAVIIAFNTRIMPKARSLADKDHVNIYNYNVIYRVFEDILEKIKDRHAPEFVTQDIGKAKIKQIFDIGKLGKIAGCLVTEGTVQKEHYAKILREEELIFDGKISNLKHHKDDVQEVKAGSECGIALESFPKDVQEGDVIICYKRETPP